MPKAPPEYRYANTGNKQVESYGDWELFDTIVIVSSPCRIYSVQSTEPEAVPEAAIVPHFGSLSFSYFLV